MNTKPERKIMCQMAKSVIILTINSEASTILHRTTFKKHPASAAAEHEYAHPHLDADFLQQGATDADMIQAYPALTVDSESCAGILRTHRAEIDRDIR